MTLTEERAASFDAVRQENAFVRYLMAEFGVTVSTGKRAYDFAVGHGGFTGKGYFVSYVRAVSETGTSRVLTVQAL